MKRVVWVLSLLLPSLAPALEAQVLRGAEIQVSSLGQGVDRAGDVAIHDDGRAVVVWTRSLNLGNDAVFVRLFDASGRARTAAFEVATLRNGSQRQPRVAMGADGGFVVVWTTNGQAWARRFAPTGTPIGFRFPLDTEIGGGQSFPEVGIAPDGRLLVAWTEKDGFGAAAPSALWARWLDATGQPTAPRFLVSDAFVRAESARIAFNSRGGVALVFQGYGGEGVFYDVFLQRYGGDGNPRSPLVQVNTDEDIVSTRQFEPSVAIADDGRTLVAWTDIAGDYLTNPAVGDANIQGVRARLLSGNGTPIGPSFPVNTFTRGDQGQPAVALTADGNFLVAWTTGGNQDGEGDGIFARYVGRDGKPTSREFRINLGRLGHQQVPVLSLARSGRGIVAWTSLPLQGSGKLGVFARRFEPR